jgi:hypothetical protein
MIFQFYQFTKSRKCWQHEWGIGVGVFTNSNSFLTFHYEFRSKGFVYKHNRLILELTVIIFVNYNSVLAGDIYCCKFNAVCPIGVPQSRSQAEPRWYFLPNPGCHWWRSCSGMHCRQIAVRWFQCGGQE